MPDQIKLGMGKIRAHVSTKFYSESRTISSKYPLFIMASTVGELPSMKWEMMNVKVGRENDTLKYLLSTDNNHA